MFYGARAENSRNRDAFPGNFVFDGDGSDWCGCCGGVVFHFLRLWKFYVYPLGRSAFHTIAMDANLNVGKFTFHRFALRRIFFYYEENFNTLFYMWISLIWNFFTLFSGFEELDFKREWKWVSKTFGTKVQIFEVYF